MFIKHVFFNNTAPVYDSTGSYQATGASLGSNDVLNHIDTSSYSTQHYAFLTGYDGTGSPIGIAYVGTPCVRLSQGKSSNNYQASF